MGKAAAAAAAAAAGVCHGVRFEALAAAAAVAGSVGKADSQLRLSPISAVGLMGA